MNLNSKFRFMNYTPKSGVEAEVGVVGYERQSEFGGLVSYRLKELFPGLSCVKSEIPGIPDSVD